MSNIINVAFTVFCVVKTVEYTYRVCRWMKKKRSKN
nr:MAG TPA: hypothetical protein [Caudoviricetes sp.]DAY02946.1 MAG TPA: hypothetical protein [Caudoviricetes sp.]